MHINLADNAREENKKEENVTECEEKECRRDGLEVAEECTVKENHNDWQAADKVENVLLANVHVDIVQEKAHLRETAEVTGKAGVPFEEN